MKNKNKDELKELIENMCQKEYRISERAPTNKGIIEVDTHTTLLAKIKGLSKQMAPNTQAQAN